LKNERIFSIDVKIGTRENDHGKNYSSAICKITNQKEEGKENLKKIQVDDNNNSEVL